MNDTTKPEKGNGVLLDWNGIGDPSNIIIEGNTITSTKNVTKKSGIYSTSNTEHENTISDNIVNGYEYGVHPYALATCK
jgi:nitrous oxidase accessory protein NosD